MFSTNFFSYVSKKLFSNVPYKPSVLLKTIPLIATIDMDTYSAVEFNNYMQLILDKFPEYEGNRAFRRVKYPSEINGPEDEFFLIAFESSRHKTVYVLYSYLNVYLLAILVGDETIYVLDENEFKFPKRLLVGLERVNVNCGIGYTHLPDRHEVRYSPTHISHSIFILSLGYTEKRSKEWKQGIVRTIGITCESLRFYWMRDLIKRTSDLNAYVVETPSTEVIKIMNSWDKISRSVRSGNPFKLGTTTHPHHTLCKIVSLLNRNDGTEMENLENSLNKCVPLNCNDCTDMEDSENPLKKSVLLNCNDGTEMVNSQKILVPSKENIGQCFLVPHHRICPIRANDDNFLSRVPSSISDRSGIPLQLITNTYSHGISSMVLSQLTRNDGFEMDNPLNGKGSLLPQRSICPRGAIAGTKEPQHSIFPRRASDCLSQVLSCISYGSGKPSKLIANAYSHTISSSLLPHHSICPRGAIVGTKEPQCSVFPRKAYGCNFLSQVLSCISYGSAKPSKLITNTYSHGISSTVFSPLTRNDDTEMGNSWNGKGKVGCLNEPSSLVPQRDICPRGAIADSLVPQHIICPRRSNAVVHYSPPLPPARAYRCPKPLYSNCLISASRMMLFFMRRR